jgi:glucose-6-phosphate isomerase
MLTSWAELKGGELIFHGIPIIKPILRSVKNLRTVTSCSLPDDEIIYSIYRDVCHPSQRELMTKHLLRYDMTLIFSKMLGNEFPKTFGHYHSLCKSVSYPEIYEVLHGRAAFLLQKASGNIAADIVLVEATEGEAVIVPPDYGHATINTSRENLVVSNVQSSLAQASYDHVMKFNGMAYFLTIKGTVKNPNYVVPGLRVISAKGVKEKFLGSSKQLHEILSESPEKFEFLNDPEGHLEKLKGIIQA